MKITSSVFENNTRIPTKYSCDGNGINPPLFFEDIPQNTKSLALIVDDPDAPGGTFVHWILFNIESGIKKINESLFVEFASCGINSSGTIGYVSPCPPSGEHRYFFKLYALDKLLDLKNPTEEDLENAMSGHILEKAELIGLYGR